MDLRYAVAAAASLLWALPASAETDGLRDAPAPVHRARFTARISRPSWTGLRLAPKTAAPATAPTSLETPAGALIGQSLGWTHAVEAGDGIAGGSGAPVFDGMRIAGSAIEAPSGAAPAAGAPSVSHGATGGGFAAPRAPSAPIPLPAASQPAEPGRSPVATGSLLDNEFDFARAQAKAADFPGWRNGDRYSACGLIAAEALQRAVERNPELDRIDEVREIAVDRRLWDANVGMHGLGAEHALVGLVGVDAAKVSLWMNSRADFSELNDTIFHALEEGKPVIVSTTRHYFFIQGWSDGKFFVGHTGEIMSAYGGKPYMTLSSIASAGAAITGILIPN
ncbi:MAG: hypothetical protein HY925_02820 [Elusimicrobia bacterium]|nr:hypothetical protein [Elusimicrobiota bacterium]